MPPIAAATETSTSGFSRFRTGRLVRLTRHAADDVDPSFSADGSVIAFQSSRPEGGIFVIPTLGGEERLLVERGFSPRFSPDGMWIAYGVSESAGSQLYIAPSSGGPGTRIASGFYLARSPVWSPDGTTLLFWGQRDRDAPAGEQRRLVRCLGEGWRSDSNHRAQRVARVKGSRRFTGYPLLMPGLNAATASFFTGTWVIRGTSGRSPCRPDGWRVGAAAASHLRHHGRSRRIDDLERADGVHEPNEQRGYLELAHRHRSRPSARPVDAGHTGSRRRLRSVVVSRRGDAGVSLTTRRAVRRRSRETWLPVRKQR